MPEIPINESSGNNPQNVWQNQTTEVFKMSAEQLRSRSQRKQNKARFEAAYSIVLGLLLFGLFAWRFIHGHELVARIGWGVLSLWCIYFAGQAYRWIWQKRVAPDATLKTTLESYRSQLEKQRDYGRNIWSRAGLNFCFLGVALVAAPALVRANQTPRLFMNVLPLFVLFILWLALFFPMRKRRRQKLQREIDELHGFESGNPA